MIGYFLDDHFDIVLGCIWSEISVQVDRHTNNLRPIHPRCLQINDFFSFFPVNMASLETWHPACRIKIQNNVKHNITAKVTRRSILMYDIEPVVWKRWRFAFWPAARGLCKTHLNQNCKITGQNWQNLVNRCKITCPYAYTSRLSDESACKVQRSCIFKVHWKSTLWKPIYPPTYLQ